MSGLAADTTFMIHAARLNEGGIPRLHIDRISSWSYASEDSDDDSEDIIEEMRRPVAWPPATPDGREVRNDHPESGGIVWSISPPRRTSIEVQNKSIGLNSNRSESCVDESIFSALLLH
jgi:hypothetical protein